MPFTERRVGGAKIYYEVFGKGPAVVFVPGGGGNHASWFQQIPHFQDRFKLIPVDWPGYGLSRSDETEFDITEWPDAILAALDDAGVERAAIVAQSLGGMPALLFAIQHPDRVAGVVLNSSVGAIRDPEFREVWMTDRSRTDLVPERERLISSEQQQHDPGKQILFRGVASFNQAKPSGGNIINHRGEHGASLAELRGLMAAGVPLWFLWGDADRTRQPSTYRLLEEMLPEATFEMLPGALHAFYWETPEVFNEALERVLGAFYPESRREETVAGE